MRKLIKVVGFLFGLLFIAVGLFLVVNYLLPDDELSPGAQAWLEREPPAFPAEENLYYYLWGLDAPEGEAVFDFGRARVERLMALNAAGYDWAALSGPDGEISGTELIARNDAMLLPDGFDSSSLLDGPARESVCHPRKENCLQFHHDAKHASLREGENAILLARYRAVLALPHYRTMETVGYNGPIPPTHRLGRLHNLYLTTLLDDFMAGGSTAALEALAADLRFYRMLLAEADYLVPKMFASAMVAGDLHLYSQLLDSGIATDEVIAAIATIAPLSEAEFAMGEVMAGELRFSSAVLDEMQRLLDAGRFEEATWQRWLRQLWPYRHNELVNLYHQILEAFLASAHLPPGPFDTALDGAIDRIDAELGVMRQLGNLHLVVVLDSYGNLHKYSYRLHDLDALLTMLKLKARIIRQGIPEDQYEAFLATAEGAVVYGDEAVPIVWDWENAGFFFIPPLYPAEHSEQLTWLPSYWVLDEDRQCHGLICSGSENNN